MYYVLWDQVFVSQITNNLLGGTNSFEAQDQFRPCRLWNSPTRDSETSSYFVPFLWDEVFALLIKKLGKIICWGGNNSHLGMFFHYTHISCSMGPLGACTKFRFLNKFVTCQCDSNATVDVHPELKRSQRLPWSQANICTYHVYYCSWQSSSVITMIWC